MTTHHMRHVDNRRSALCLVAGLLATWAFAGSLGLITGVVSLGAAETRLPWQSPIVAGVMLALVVGLPMTVVALGAAHGDSRMAETAMFAASALIGWIVLQLVIVRELSWLQPVCVILAVAVAALGASAREHHSAVRR